MVNSSNITSHTTSGQYDGFLFISSASASALSHGASVALTFPLVKTGILSSFEANFPCTIRVYTSKAKRDADLSRGLSTIAGVNSGQIAEVVLTSPSLSFSFQQPLIYTNLDSPQRSKLYCIIFNTSGATNTLISRVSYASINSIDAIAKEVRADGELAETNFTANNSVAAGASYLYSIPLSKVFLLSSLKINFHAQFRVYSNVAAATADASRPANVSATVSGLILDTELQANTWKSFDTPLLCLNLETPQTGYYPVRIFNLSSSATTLALDLSLVSIDANPLFSSNVNPNAPIDGANLLDSSVTLDKLEDIPTASVIGRYSPLAGEPEVLSLSSNFTTTGGVLDVSVGASFSSNRQTLSADLQLTASSATYQYLDVGSSTWSVILPQTPVQDDFKVITKYTSTGILNVKETTTGPVVVSLVGFTRIAQCHFDGVEWQIILLGTN